MLIDINTAVEILNSDGVVAVPTETVYGLAARYDSESAIRKVYTIKNRPLDHPLIVHIGTAEWLDVLTQKHPSYLLKLVKEFWPGPLTVVLQRSSKISNLLTAKQSTVAVRMPSHPVCLDLLSRLKKPIVAPSANLYCQISPTSYQHVLKYFPKGVPVIDGDVCKFGIESTIILATEEKSIEILRPGVISQAMIEKIANIKCISPRKKIKISGNKERHYSPNIPLILFKKRAEIFKYVNNNEKKFFFILLNKFDTKQHTSVCIENDPVIYAAKIYSLWHFAEEGKYDAIFIEKPVDNQAWAGINNRISKASVRFSGDI